MKYWRSLHEDASSSCNEKSEAPETDEAPASVSSSFAYHIRKTMGRLAMKAYPAVCQALSRGRKIFMVTT
jgi:hypothetical protein